MTALDEERTALRRENAELKEQVVTWKRIAERNHRANMMPCIACGHKPAVIKAAQGNQDVENAELKAQLAEWQISYAALLKAFSALVKFMVGEK